MRSVEWSSDALDDFELAIGYIAIDSPVAATAVADRIFEAADLLASMPTGRQGRVKGTYEKFVQNTSYTIAYAMSDRMITVLRVIHAKRNWPAGEWPAE
jgi:toxin ParE1/3/4